MCDLIQSLTECYSWLVTHDYNLTFNVIIFDQVIEKNDPSERGCQTESTLCPRSKGYVSFVCNKMGEEFRWLQDIPCYTSIYRWNPWSNWVQTAFGEKSRMERVGHRI